MSSEEKPPKERMIAPQLSERSLFSTGIMIGTMVKTKYMRRFIIKTRPDGLNIIDVNRTLSRIDVAGKLIARIGPQNLVVASVREYAKVPIEKFAELTGSIPITGRFMPGTFTNPMLPFYLSPELLLVVDPQLDSQAIDEASKVGIPVISICDTDNVPENIDLIIPANNRGRKALAAVFWLLARAVLIHSGKLKPDEPMKYTIEEFETKPEEPG